MANLASTAGFDDPQRLQWAMEAVAIADLVDQPQVITVEDTSVALSITAGKPEITITKAGKTFKAVPAKLKKNPDIEALIDRRRQTPHRPSPRPLDDQRMAPLATEMFHHRPPTAL